MARRVQQIAHRPLYKEAVSELRAAILGGVFRPGERLRESDLARQLNLSRGPVREALRQLEQEGIVTALPHVGVSVTLLDLDEIEDVMSMREFIETFKCEQTIRKLTDDDLAELRRLVDEMKAAAVDGDGVLVSELDVAFHELLVSKTASSAVKTVWRSLVGQIRIHLSFSDPVFLREFGDVGESHRGILEALEARDARRLRKALKAHVEETRLALRRLLGSLDLGDGRTP
jgi:DNA-binding GntR family transcriptional regulator